MGIMAEKASVESFNHPHPESGANHSPLQKNKMKKRALAGNPDPEAEVIAFSPTTLMATHRFVCEVCGKGFQREQNLQLHRRGHNLPWKLKQKMDKETKKNVYICPERSCVHNHPCRALGDLSGIKKHFRRKHREKKWKCEKCSKRYAVQSDWKAHSKICGTKEYKCGCGTIFSRRDSFITHQAFCDALAEETARINAASSARNAVESSCSADQLGRCIAQNLPSIFRSFSAIDSTVKMTNDELFPSPLIAQSTELPATLDYHSEDFHEFHPSNSLFSSSYLQPSDHLPISFDSTIHSNNVEKLKSTYFPHLSNARERKSSFVNVPSLDRKQKNYGHESFSSNMSATALLQKASEIRASSSNSTTFEGTTELSGFHAQNPELRKFHVNGIDERESNIIEVNSERRRHIQSAERGGGGQTRDFFGAGATTMWLTVSIDGWI